MLYVQTSHNHVRNIVIDGDATDDVDNLIPSIDKEAVTAEELHELIQNIVADDNQDAVFDDISDNDDLLHKFDESLFDNLVSC